MHAAVAVQTIYDSDSDSRFERVDSRYAILNSGLGGGRRIRIT